MNHEQIKTLALSHNHDASQREDMLAEYCLMLIKNVEKLKYALKFECGNRCSDMNPCNANEALRELEEME